MTSEAVAKVVPVPEARAIKIPSVLRCAVTIFAVKLVLRSRGFGWTMRWLRQRVGAIPVDTMVDVEVVKAAERAVAMAGALYPGRAMCLEQSVVLYYLLRRQRIAVKYCQGVQPHPFAAHAWIEYRGEPINDVAEHVKWFVRLPEELT